ncbi:MAG: AAA family ATPase [Gammaproteobacteria bacterium]|nr:AAA family ATPase [Gammaproteobacteria bacterium]MDE0269949.1 AAA family ATPase [Gammaproteobacteria bacterium]
MSKTSVTLSAVQLANVRAMEMAEIRFQPDFNLIVGVNGVGKSTVLDALRICMSRILPSVSDSRAKAISFDVNDVRYGSSFLDVELSLNIGEHEFSFTRRQWRDVATTDDLVNVEQLRRRILDSNRPRDRKLSLLRQIDESPAGTDTDYFWPSKRNFQVACREAVSMPNCVFFSTARSMVSHAKAKSRSTGGTASAYTDALIRRPLYIARFTEWMKAQEDLAKEQPLAEQRLSVLQAAVSRFLPDYGSLTLDKTKGTDESSTAAPPRLLINRGGSRLRVDQLSDGERGVLALVLDLARRLAQANSKLEDPLTEGEAIVLIDEIDLHLHPTWQRQIVHKLTDTFPRCQFIATTHSPQVIGEVNSNGIHIMADGEVYSPAHSFGVDSSRVLEEVMDAHARNFEIQELLQRISDRVGDDLYSDARNLLDQLAERVGEDDPEVTRVRTLLDFLEDE